MGEHRVTIPASLTAAAALGALAGLWPAAVCGLLLGGGVVALVAARPPWAAYVYLAVAPLVMGLERGELIPLVRLNEALLALLLMGLVLGPVRRWVLSGRPLPAVSPVDWCVLALAGFSSITSLAWMLARGLMVTAEDVQFALTLWKYLALYLLVRISLRDDRSVSRALSVVLVTSAVVAVLGILQALQVGPFPQLLSPFIASDDQDKVLQLHAKSTIGASIAFGDVMAIATALSVTQLMLARRRRVVLALASVLFAIATLASGQVSSVLGLLIVVVATGGVLGRLRSLLVAGVPVVLASAVLLQPAIKERLATVDPSTGLPAQWTGEGGRLANLQTYFWPRLSEGLNWLLGVQTSSRVAAPEPWREWVWIESGYTWLLWNGGVPLLLAFIAYMFFAVRTTLGVARTETGPGLRTASVSALAGLSMLAVLMVVDAHLTLRGSADLLFPLTAMAVTGALRASGASTTGQVVARGGQEGLLEPASVAAPTGAR